MKRRKFTLDEKDIPRKWYNIVADLPNPLLPPLHPGTKKPISPDLLEPLFPMSLIKQEVSQNKWEDIPDEIRDAYKDWRPTPLYRALNLEKHLQTDCKIYYKYEGTSPTGSHKPNTAIPQAYYNKEEGVKKLATETGAGQWGSALSYACNMFGLECEVFMVKISYEQKPYRKTMMNIWEGTVHASPSIETKIGKSIIEKTPDSPGSLGIAISEAIERALESSTTKYSLGSVLNHVLMHQTIIGLEAEKQMELADTCPDIIIAPFGGGSNFAGISFPFLRLNLNEGKKIRCIASEPASCPKLTRGQFQYDYGDTVGLTPLIPMFTLGHNFVPPKIHAGGLRYHGAGAIVSQLLKDRLIEACSHNQLACFSAGVKFAKLEGITPAPEATHAIATVLEEVEISRKEGRSKTILFNLCGHGHFDMSSYEDYFSNKLKDHEISEKEIAESLADLKSIDVSMP